MSFNTIKTKTQAERGFTIVELLIVIVVIGILAAITFVSYNGVTQRASTVAAQTAANTVLKKAGAFNAETSAYPTTPGALTTGATGESYEVTGITFTSSELTEAPASGDDKSSINFYACDGAAGVRVSYFDYSTKDWVAKTTGTCAATPVFTYVGA